MHFFLKGDFCWVDPAYCSLVVRTWICAAPFTVKMRVVLISYELQRKHAETEVKKTSDRIS
jgi:hypothetical protein